MTDSRMSVLWWMLGFGLTLSVGVAALGEFAGLVALPYGLRPLAERMPTAFAAHMAASGLALPLILLALRLRGPHPWHKAVGRAAAATTLVGGLTAIPVALASDAIPAARLGFLVQALLWLWFLWAGVAAARARDFARHRRAMVMMAATASGAVVLRLLLYPLAWLWLPYGETYAALAWGGWAVPLAITALVLRSRARRSPRRRRTGAGGSGAARAEAGARPSAS